jgi:ABC-type dipeptide/oligopeptide/nickel transport system permease component
MRIVRSSVLEVLGSDYTMMVRVKGMPWRIPFWQHVIKTPLPRRSPDEKTAMSAEG